MEAMIRLKKYGEYVELLRRDHKVDAAVNAISRLRPFEALDTERLEEWTRSLKSMEMHNCYIASVVARDYLQDEEPGVALAGDAANAVRDICKSEDGLAASTSFLSEPGLTSQLPKRLRSLRMLVGFPETRNEAITDFADKVTRMEMAAVKRGTVRDSKATQLSRRRVVRFAENVC